MKLLDKYDGSQDPFEGEKTLLWSSLPSGAKVTKARLKLTPVPREGGTLFQEEIRFQGTQGDWSATKANGGNGNPFVEIDFHQRRTLISVDSTNLDNASLQVDMGGVFVEINSQGAIKTPPDMAFQLPSTGALPGLTVSKFRLVATAAGSTSDVSRVLVRSVPSNINVRLGKMGAFWPRLGDLVNADTSPDFAEALQVFLNSAEVKNGFYAVPIVIHSENITRLLGELEVDYVQQVSLVPDSVKEVVLPFDYASLPNAQPGVLSVSLPANAQVQPGSTTAKVLGKFEETRVIYGRTGEISPEAAVLLSPSDSQAQQFVLEQANSVTGLDLYLAPQPPGINLAVDLRADLDGKPDEASLLGSPVQATIASRPDKKASWINVPLGKELHLQSKEKARYWVVLQSLQGEAQWSVASSGAAAVMQHTIDGGLSWRETPAPASASPPSAFFRLRNQPASFQVPVDLQVGSGPEARRVKLDRFQPLGRVEFDLDIPEVAQGFNQYVAAVAPAVCSDAEHLANGSFEQWIVVGNEVSDPRAVQAITASARVGAVAASPDGKNAYVGLVDTLNTSNRAFLVTVDAACNTPVGSPIDLGSGLTPEFILVYPDGSKALVIIGRSLALIDLRRAVVLKTATFPETAIAFSSDGSRLFVAGSSAGNALLRSVDTQTFEQAILNNKVAELLAGAQKMTLDGAPVALAADQGQLYALNNVADAAGASNGTVFFLDPQSLLVTGQTPSGKEALAFAVTRDTGRVAIANIDNSVSIIDTNQLGVTNIPLPGDQPGVAAVCVSPDGRRAFVGTNTDSNDSTMHVIDLAKRKLITSIPAGKGLTSMAITPQGDEVYIGADLSPALQFITIGQRLPADWFVTSGKLEVLCLPQVSSAHVVVGLAASNDAGKPVRPGSFSQVTPVTGGCTYEFSFEGLTTDPDAVAEILWRGSDCQSPKTDSVPIPLVTRSSNVIGPPKAPSAKSSREFKLIPARVRLTAPAQATAAEVRFTVPNEAAVVAVPSLRGDSQALLNGDLQRVKTGVPEQWTLSPAGAAAFLVTPDAGDVLLRNAGPSTVDLVQSASVTGGQDFVLEFSGRAAPSDSDTQPSVQLHWLRDDGSQAGDIVSEDVTVESFAEHPMSGRVPGGTAKVELHLSLPSGTALSVENVLLRMPNNASVPVSFIAQSPGELRVSAAQVAYDTVPTPPPPVPVSGLCSPTAPGELPGKPAPTCDCCPSCGTEVEDTNVVATMTPSGRPMTLVRCADCGMQAVRGGGQLVRSGPALTLRTVSHELPPPATVERPSAPTVHVLSEVTGIGAGRARQLKRAGIKSVRELATADPSYVAQAVRGVSVRNAVLLIEHARQLLAKDG